MSSYLTTIKRRLVTLEKSIMAGLGVAADAYPYAMATQEDFPYFTNRLSEMEPAPLGDDITLRSYEILIRLVIGHLGEFDGEDEAFLDEHLPAIEDEFARQHWLTTFDEPDAVVDLHPRGVEFRRSSGLRVFDNSALGADFPSQIGVEFTLTAHIYRDIEKRYG